MCSKKAVPTGCLIYLESHFWVFEKRLSSGQVLESPVNHTESQFQLWRVAGLDAGAEGCQSHFSPL